MAQQMTMKALQRFCIKVSDLATLPDATVDVGKVSSLLEPWAQYQAECIREAGLHQGEPPA